MKKTALLSFLLLAVAFQAFAQDIITKRDGTSMKVVIDSKNGSKLFYRDYDDPQKLLYVIDMSEVAIITYEDGYTEKYITKKEEAIMNGTYVKRADDGLRHHNFYVGAGAGFIPSSVMFENLSPTGGNIRTGSVHEIGYEYSFRSGFTLGVLYSAYHSTCNALVGSHNGFYSIYVPFIGPTVGFDFNVGKFFSSERLGIGYAGVNENFSINGGDIPHFTKGVGIHVSADLGYRISPSTVLGLRLCETDTVIMDQTSDDARGELECLGIKFFLQLSL